MHRGLLDDVFRAVQRTGAASTLRPLSLLAVALTPLTVLGFWTSVTLPVAYIPLYLTGIIGGATASRLVLAHAVAVVVGHSYGR